MLKPEKTPRAKRVVPSMFSEIEVLGAITRIVYRHALAEILLMNECPWVQDEAAAAKRVANAVLKDIHKLIAKH